MRPSVISSQSQPKSSVNPGVPAIMSFLIPGLGQVYKGQIFNGFVWLVLVITGYAFFIIPGLILHLLCVIGASSYRK